METVSENRAFGGIQGVYTHSSKSCQCDMTFGLFLPEEAKLGPVPVLWYVGLTCTHENAMTKAGAQSWAAEQGIALVFPDTSPRGEGVADDEAYDLGQGAGFYVNATNALGAAFFDVGLRGRGAASAAGVEFCRRYGTPGYHRAFDGRAWRADAGHEPARPVQIGFGLCTDFQPDCGGLGAQTIVSLSEG